MHRDALVFVARLDKPRNRRSAANAIRVAGDAARLNSDGRQPIGMHDLRRSFAAIVLET